MKASLVRILVKHCPVWAGWAVQLRDEQYSPPGWTGGQYRSDSLGGCWEWSWGCQQSRIIKLRRLRSKECIFGVQENLDDVGIKGVPSMHVSSWSGGVIRAQNVYWVQFNVLGVWSHTIFGRIGADEEWCEKRLIQTRVWLDCREGEMKVGRF